MPSKLAMALRARSGPLGPRSGERWDPRWRASPSGGIDIDYCAFPTCPGNPRGIVSAPALSSCTLLPPPPPPTPSATLSGLERGLDKDKEITAPADPLPGTDSSADPLFRVGERIDARQGSAKPRQIVWYRRRCPSGTKLF